MPTFQIFNKVDKLVGADPTELEVCLIWLSGNIAWSLIKFVAISRASAVSHINGGKVAKSLNCFVCL